MTLTRRQFSCTHNNTTTATIRCAPDSKYLDVYHSQLYIFGYMYLCALGRVICVSAGSSNANSISYYQSVANQIVSLDMAKSCQTDVNDVVRNTNGNALNFDCSSNLQYVCRAPIPPHSPHVQSDCCLGSHYFNGCSVYVESGATSFSLWEKLLLRMGYYKEM